jgi:hypothetical protein
MNLIQKTLWMISMISILSVIGNCSDAYKKVTVVRGQIHFSFQYPSSFRDPHHTLKDSTDVTKSIALSRTEKTSDDLNDSVLIEIYEPYVASDVDVFVEHFLSAWNQLPDNQQFKLVGRTPVNVDGISGIQLIYSIIYKGAGDTLNPYISYVQEVYFKHNELYWNIRLISVPELAEQSKNEFVRIIDSFNFLE